MIFSAKKLGAPLSWITPIKLLVSPPTPPEIHEPKTEVYRTKIKVKLADGKERNIQHIVFTSFWHPYGTSISAQQFMELLFGKLPRLPEVSIPAADCSITFGKVLRIPIPYTYPLLQSFI